MAKPGSARAFNRTATVRVGLPVLAVLAAYIMRWAVGPVLGERSPFLLFTLPVLLAMVVGGRFSGFLAGILALLAGFSFIPAAVRFSDSSLLQALLFVLACAGVGWLGSRLIRQSREAALAAEQLRLLLEGASQYAIFMVDPHGIITSWNRGAERIYGRTADQAIGRHCALFSAEPDAEAITDAELEEAAREGRFAGELWQVRADRSEFLASVSITPVEEDGKLRGFAKVVCDVTDRRASERALEKREWDPLESTCRHASLSIL